MPGAGVTLKSERPPSRRRLAQRVRRFAGIRVVVWGDFVLDEYWLCTTRRVSREAPVLILDFDGREAAGGGAANAALNLAAMGAEAKAVGWVGRDEAARELRALLRRGGVDTAGLVELPGCPTVVKSRILSGAVHTARQQVVRVDRGHALDDTHRSARARMLAELEASLGGAGALLLSDYGYAAVDPRLVSRRARQWRGRGVVVALDARYALGRYRDVSLATPNESEAGAAVGREVRDEDDLCRVAARLRAQLRPELLVITRGRDGLAAWPGKEGFKLPPWGPSEAVDPTGAGDAVVSAATLALAAGAGPMECAALANVAGSVAVSRRGTAPVERQALLDSLGSAP